MLKIGNTILPDFPLVLAPMEDITDSAFREICKEQGADLVFTEFVSSEGLKRQIDQSKQKLLFREVERPIAAQIFGNNADSMRAAAESMLEFAPDMIDLNFGCPVKKIVSKGCGAALLLDPGKMCEITRAVVSAVNVPVMVKTRLGWDEQHKIIVTLAEMLQDTGIAAISIHGRTKAQMYTGTADWTLIGEVKKNPRMHIPVIGNGDIDGPEKAIEMFDHYGVDGIMIGRASVGNPWIFADIKHYMKTGKRQPKPAIDDRIEICSRHLTMAVARKGERKGMLEMRRHYSGYFKGYGNFKPYRMKLLTANNLEQVLAIMQEIKDAYYGL
jgi:tRNA-dihydrouridine synthase B